LYVGEQPGKGDVTLERQKEDVHERMQLLRVLPLAREQFMSRPTARPHRVQRPSTTLVDFLSALRATVVSELASSGPQGVFD
jgi:hypothetical protein